MSALDFSLTKSQVVDGWTNPSVDTDMIALSTPVPEPSTYALGTIAMGVLGFAARRRKGRSA